MASVRPKIIESGGISPKGWTSVFTLPFVMAGFYSEEEALLSASRAPIAAKSIAEYPNLDYLIESDQLTKEPPRGTPVTGGYAQA
jgi:hypothetical protein